MASNIPWLREIHSLPRAYPGYDEDSPLNVQTGFHISGSIAFSKNVSYSYYADGSKSSILTPSGTFSYDYDSAGRPSSLTNPFGETTSWSYSNNNWLTGQTLANGGATAYTYNAKALVTQLVNKDGGGNVLSNFSGMTYDGVGNRSTLTATVPSYTAYSGNTSYAYDNRNELQTETSTRTGGYTNNFVYDGAENPTTLRSVAGQTYNNDNQKSNTGYAFDGDGNPTTYNSSSMAFDAENRMTSVGSSLTAGYDAGNVRAWSSSGGATTYYLYAGNPTLPICELNSSGAVTATNTAGLDGLVSRNTSGGSIFYEFDEQGTVAERLNSSGSCTSSGTADAFGVVANSGTVSDPFGYVAQAGYYTDQATGLILTTFRYYDPVNGRFLNRDPVGYEGGIDLYSYVHNNVENEIDSWGLMGMVGIMTIGITTEEMGGALDATGVGAPPGILLNILGGVILAGCFIVVVGILGNMSSVRGGNKLQPDPRAGGPHTTFRPGHYETWLPNPNPQDPKPWVSGGRYDGEGAAHDGVPCPHVHPPSGPVRPAGPGEGMRGFN